MSNSIYSYSQIEDKNGVVVLPKLLCDSSLIKKNKIKKVVASSYFDTTTKGDVIYFQKFDEQGQLISAKGCQWLDEDPCLEKVNKAMYYSSGKLISIVEPYVEKGKKYIDSSRISYYPNGKIKEVYELLILTNGSRNDTLYTTTNYEYDLYKNLKQINILGHNKFYYSIEQYNYDSIGKLLSFNLIDQSGKPYQFGQNLYNPSGQLISETVKENGIQTEKNIYSYNKTGMLILKKCYDFKDTLITTEYIKYDGKGRVIEKYIRDAGVEESGKIITLSYEKKTGMLIEKTITREDKKKISTFKYHYKSNGFLEKEEFYNPSGDLERAIKLKCF
ncbi:MAG: hypothetical protein NTX03_00115 [Bacteroidetes bacterium]|nr:hypothetical protein [Bacteroidota bacterium]